MSYYQFRKCSRCNDTKRVYSRKHNGFVRCPKCSPIDVSRRSHRADALRMCAYSIKDYWDDPTREDVIQENIRQCVDLGASWAELKDRTGKSTEELKQALAGQRSF